MKELFDTIERYYQEGKQDAIEPFLLQAYQTASAGGLELAFIANELASFYRGIGRLEEAIQYFSVAADVFLQCGTAYTLQYLTVVMNWAGAERMAGAYQRAQTMLLKVKNSLEEKGLQTEYLYVTTLNNLALVYQGQKQWVQASALMACALEQLEIHQACEHELATGYHNLAALALEQGALLEAEQALEKAFTYFDTMEKTDIHQAAALQTRGVLRYKKGDYGLAEQDFIQAIEETEFFFGDCKQSRVLRGYIQRTREKL